MLHGVELQTPRRLTTFCSWRSRPPIPFWRTGLGFDVNLEYASENVQSHSQSSSKVMTQH